MEVKAWKRLPWPDNRSAFAYHIPIETELGRAYFQDERDAEKTLEAVNAYDSLKSRVAQLEGALRFYADDKNWEEEYQSVPYGSTTAQMPLGSAADEDHGFTAKEALDLKCGNCGDDGEEPSQNCPTCNGTGFKALSHPVDSKEGKP